MDNRTLFIATGVLAIAGMPCMVHATQANAHGTTIASVGGATAAAGCVGDAGLSPLQRRLVAKYDQDPQILMQFVWRTRSIHQLDRMETAQWAESYRRAHPRC